MEENFDLLNLQDSAKLLGVKVITLRKWDREGKLKAVRVGPRRDRKYRKSDIENFLQSSKQKIEWQEYIRDGASYHQSYTPVEAFRNGLKKYFGQGVQYLMNYFEGNTMYWYYEKNDIYEVGKRIIEKLLASKKFEDEFFRLWDKKSEDILGFIKNNSKEKLSKMNNLQLTKLYKKFTDFVCDWYSLTLSIDGTDEFLMIDITKRVKKILREELKDDYTEKEFINAYNILTAPSKLSYLNDEKRLILEIVRDLSLGKLKRNSSEFDSKIKKILDEFWWTSLGWARGKAKNKSDIVPEIDNTQKSKVDAKKEIEEIKNYEIKTKTEKKELEKKYSFHKDKKLSELLRILDRLFIYHDYRKEIQVKYNYYEYQILDEISKRFRIHPSFLEWCEPKEIIDLLEYGNFDEQEINQRKSHFLYINTKDRLVKLSGKRALEEHKKVFEFALEKTRDLQGISACPGKVVGTAFVALTVDSAMKIKKGQILVTGMTTPDFLPAMKKAAAIVTDEGGITCHAAVVSREFKIPCIVGTKSSTRIINTGDVIEVSANHGVVKILEKS